MDWLDKVASEFITAFSITRPVGAKRSFVDLIVGGLLIVLAVGGLAM